MYGAEELFSTLVQVAFSSIRRKTVRTGGRLPAQTGTARSTNHQQTKNDARVFTGKPYAGTKTL
jgi:hypothetical protein